MHNLDNLSKYEQELTKAIYGGMSRYSTSGFSDMDKMAQLRHLTDLLRATAVIDIRYHKVLLDKYKSIASREIVTVQGNEGYKGLARLEDNQMHGVFLGKNYIDGRINYEEQYISMMEDSGDMSPSAIKHYKWLEAYFMDALSKTNEEDEFQIEIIQLFILANEDLQEVIGVAMGDV